MKNKLIPNIYNIYIVNQPIYAVSMLRLTRCQKVIQPTAFLAQDKPIFMTFPPNFYWLTGGKVNSIWQWELNQKQ